MAAREMPAPSTRGRSLAASVAVVAALAVAGVGLMRNTWAVGGSDSSCYGLMADAFARGELQPRSPLVHEAPWPNAALTFAPGGFIPSPTRVDGASPICAPGFSMLLAPFRWAAGADGIFVVSPLAGALLVWLAFVLGKQIAGSFAGAIAAVFTATMPIVLFQVVQPMNDIVVATLWMAVLVSATAREPRRWWLLGAFTGFAILVRPNLAPSALVVAAWIAMTAGWRGLIIFAFASAPFGALLGALNVALYGHPLQSGYGSTSDLFALRHLMANLRNYGSALLQTQLGVPLLGLLAVFAIPRDARPVAWLAVGISGSIAAVYLLYRPFEEWWYLRFLLPALTALTPLAAAGFAWAFRAADNGSLRLILRVAMISVGISIALFGLHTATERHVFSLQRLERRFRTTGEVVRDRFPRQAAFITVWHSGTVRFHADRPAILWDSLDPQSLDRVVTWLSERGLEPYIVVERWEEPLFRQRFANDSRLGDLDWPPRFDIERQVRIFKPSDRTTYMQGGNVPTEYRF